MRENVRYAAGAGGISVPKVFYPISFLSVAALRAPLIYMSHFVTILEEQVEEGVNLKHLKARDNAQLTN